MSQSNHQMKIMKVRFTLPYNCQLLLRHALNAMVSNATESEPALWWVANSSKKVWHLVDNWNNFELVHDVLAWLHSKQKPKYFERQRTLSHQRVSGTGEWLLETPEFLEWKDGTGAFLWLDGISKQYHSLVNVFALDEGTDMFVVGAGKSTLAWVLTGMKPSKADGLR